MTSTDPGLVLEEFEKRLIGSPNSSLLWIKYMSTMLKLVDIQKARAVAERALQTISFREEQEKLNVWIAYMNLENLYGTAGTLQKVVDRALVYCDPRTVYIQLALLLQNSGKDEEALKTYQTLVKKFATSCKVWVSYAEYLYEKDLGSARKVLQQALKSLPKRKHDKVTMKFAQIEYKMASFERGRTLFEGILSNHPKRIDIWSIYVTMEENLCKKDPPSQRDYLRRLFERIVHMKLSSKKAKYFFKRFLEFEKHYGTESTVAHVKNLARQYVESSSNK